jgi:phenylalanyl-tRNA synthetase alpha chain
MHKDILIEAEEQKRLVSDLQGRTDIKAERIKRLMGMPDLSRTEGSPLKALADRVLAIKEFENFDNIIIPEITPTNILFDMFNFAADHPARSESDTYYVDDKNVLRTHDTVMWYYYLNNPEIRERIAKKEELGVFCYGKVYRKDEVDQRHMNVFHQMGGLYLVPDDKKILTIEDLKTALALIVKSICGPDMKFRFNEDKFPYTDPSLEVELDFNGKWIELLGCGMPKKAVLKNFGLEGYNGWAFGFGLERLAIAKMEIPDIRVFWSQDSRIKEQLKNPDQKYKEVSKYPPINRDISFIIDKSVNLNNYYEVVRDEAIDLIEEVKLMDQYENDEKFGAGKKSYTFHIVYRSLEKTLTDEEVNRVHDRIVEKTKKEFNAIIR